MSTRREAAGDTPQTPSRDSPKMAPRRHRLGQPRGLHPPPPPPRGINLKAQNPATVSWGLGRPAAAGDLCLTAERNPEGPGGTTESPGQGTRDRGAGPGSGGPPAVPQPQRPRAGRGAPSPAPCGAPHGLTARTHAPHTAPRSAQPRRRRPGDALGHSPLPAPSSAPSPTRPESRGTEDAPLT